MSNPLTPRIWEFDLTALMSPPTNLAHAAFCQLLIEAQRLTEMHWHIVRGHPILPAGGFYEVGIVPQSGNSPPTPTDAREDDDNEPLEQPDPVPEGRCTDVAVEDEVVQLVQSNPPEAVDDERGRYGSDSVRSKAPAFQWTEPNLESAMRAARDIREEVIIGRLGGYTNKDKRVGYWDTSFDVLMVDLQLYAKTIANINPVDWQSMRRVERIDLAEKLMGDLPPPDFGPRLELAYRDAERAAALLRLPPEQHSLKVRAAFSCLALDAHFQENFAPADQMRPHFQRLISLANDFKVFDLAEKLEDIANSDRPQARLANSSAYDRLKTQIIDQIGTFDDPAKQPLICSITLDSTGTEATFRGKAYRLGGHRLKTVKVLIAAFPSPMVDSELKDRTGNENVRSVLADLVATPGLGEAFVTPERKRGQGFRIRAIHEL